MRRLAAIWVAAACGASSAKAVDNGARLAGVHDAVAVRRILGDVVMNGGLSFDDAACAARFGAGGEVSGPAVDELAACLAKLGLRVSPRLDGLLDVAVLEYGAGIEVEARFVDGRVAWIGYSARLEGDALPTVAATALEALRTAGDRDGPVDPTVVDPVAKPHAWLKVCVDADGAVTDATVRETTSTPGARAFVAAARAWRFKPFVLGAQPSPVCAMFSMTFPPVHASDERERLPIPMTLRHDQILVPQQELTRIAGDKAVAPDDETKVGLTQLGLARLIGSFKICLDTAGKPTEVAVLRSTRSLRYDQRIIQMMRGWTYAPLVIDGQPQAACTAVTFIYNQR